MEFTTEPKNETFLLTAGDFLVHRAANVVPLDSDFGPLEDSIKRTGQIEAIALYKGSILDGRRRAIVCKHLGVQIRTDEISTSGELTEKEIYEFVLAKNTRRSLSKAQLAMVAAIEASKNSHKVMGISRATVYAKQVWGVGASSYDKAKFIFNNDLTFANEIFSTGFATIDGNRTSMVQVFEFLKRRGSEAITTGIFNKEGDPITAKLFDDLNAFIEERKPFIDSGRMGYVLDHVGFSLRKP